MRTYLPAFASSALAALAGCGAPAGSPGEATRPDAASTPERSSSAPARAGALHPPATEPIPDSATPAAPKTGSPGTVPPVPAAADGTVGGDGSPIRLGLLDGAALQGTHLTGELACGFGASGASPPLLLARGDVASTERAQALVRNNGYVERLTAAEPGGYDAITDGVRFAGRGLTATIALTGAAPRGSGESPAVPATMTVDRADGARRVIPGTWTCGP